MTRRLLFVLVACGAPPRAPTPTPPVAPPPIDAAVVATVAPQPAPPPPPPPPAEPPLRIDSCGSETLFVGPPVTSAISGAEGDIGAGDVDGDGNIDVVVGGGGQVTVMFGKGDGGFSLQATYPLLAGDEARSIALADFDNDNDLDIIVDGGSGPPEVFLNNSDGSFGLAQHLDGPAHTDAARVVRAGDLDGDKDADIVELSGADVTAWYQQAGKFARVDLGRVGLDHPRGLAMADVDRDGAADLVIAGRERGQAAIEVRRGTHAHKLAAPQRARAEKVDGDAVAVVVTDIDGDGKLDVAALFATAPTNGVATGAIVVWTGKGDGTFAPRAQLPVTDIDERTSLLATDLEPDGFGDLVVTTTHGLAIYRSFKQPVVVPATDVRAITAADLHNDRLHALVGLAPGHGAIVWPTVCR